jgi:hypothetical protein
MKARQKQQGRVGGSGAIDIEQALAGIALLNIEEVRGYWRETMGSEPPAAFSRDLLARAICHRLQEEYLGGLSPRMRRLVASSGTGEAQTGQHLKVGSIIVREHQNQVHEVMILPDGYCWQGQTYSSLSTIAKKITGTSWSGPRFFGVGRKANSADLKGPATEGLRS